MKTAEIFQAVLTDWRAAMCSPKIAREMFFCTRRFPGFTGQMLRLIHLYDGNWRLAVADVLANRCRLFPLPFERVRAFNAWADEITRRPVRGLLDWKGGSK